MTEHEDRGRQRLELIKAEQRARDEKYQTMKKEYAVMQDERKQLWAAMEAFSKPTVVQFRNERVELTRGDLDKLQGVTMELAFKAPSASRSITLDSGKPLDDLQSDDLMEIGKQLAG